MRSCISSMGEAAATAGTCSITADSSSRVRKSLRVSVIAPTPPPAYSSSTMLVPTPWIVFRTYCLPVRPMVTTRMSEAEPMTIPSAVSAKRTLLARKLSKASNTISLRTIVRLALSRVFWNERR